MFKMWKLEEGKMTVEAAFVVSITISVLALILCFFFYSYESGMAAGLLEEELMKATMVTTRKQTITDRAKECEAAMKKQMAVRSVFGNHAKVLVTGKADCLYGKIENQVFIFTNRQHCMAGVRVPADQLRRWQQLE